MEAAFEKIGRCFFSPLFHIRLRDIHLSCVPPFVLLRESTLSSADPLATILIFIVGDLFRARDEWSIGGHEQAE